MYARYALAGALCCALTHGAVVPLDVVKTRMQLEPGVYAKGLLATGLHLVREEGALLGPYFIRCAPRAWGPPACTWSARRVRSWET